MRLAHNLDLLGLASLLLFAARAVFPGIFTVSLRMKYVEHRKSNK